MPPKPKKSRKQISDYKEDLVRSCIGRVFNEELTVQEAAKSLGCPYTTFYGWIKILEDKTNTVDQLLVGLKCGKRAKKIICCRAAGTTELDLECSFHNGCSIGEAKMTLGYKLPAKFVIHTVGPRTEESELLASCYKTSLNLAVVKNIRTIAFPCISTGIYGYPHKNAAIVVLKTVRDWLQANGDSIDRIIFTLCTKEDIEIYHSLMPLFFPLVSS